MSGNLPFYIVLSALAGVLIPIMAALSGALGRTLDNPQVAALVVITGAFLMVLAFTLATGANGFRWAQLAQATPVQLASGFAMAFYLLSITYLAPRFGVGNAVMLVVAGQIASAAAIDHFGLFGAPQKPVDAMRAGGLVIMVIGVVIAQLAANGARPQN
ncbi:MAG: DMT family transporter [Hyphomonadaceae bacterium]|nr:DMT family transporter [Hyphomonadaceae bacterium]MBX3510069.1 DMT family transporter [Hyphomonadaceae bacterium]